MLEEWKFCNEGITVISISKGHENISRWGDFVTTGNNAKIFNFNGKNIFSNHESSKSSQNGRWEEILKAPQVCLGDDRKKIKRMQNNQVSF